MKEGSEIHCSVRSANEHGTGLWSEHSVTVLLKDSCDWKAEKSSAPKKAGGREINECHLCRTEHCLSKCKVKFAWKSDGNPTRKFQDTIVVPKPLQQTCTFNKEVTVMNSVVYTVLESGVEMRPVVEVFDVTKLVPRTIFRKEVRTEEVIEMRDRVVVKPETKCAVLDKKVPIAMPDCACIKLKLDPDSCTCPE